MRHTLCIVFILLMAASLAADPAQTLQFGMRLYNDGLYEEAVRAFEDVVRQAPASTQAEEALFYTGESWRKRGDWVRASVFYRRLLDGFPSSARREEALLRWGESLVEQGQFEEATVPFEELVQRYPQSQHTRAALAPLAHTWFETGQYRRVVETVEEWQKSYKGHPDLPGAVYWEAEALISSDLPAEGRTLLERLATESRDHDAGWMAVHRLAQMMEAEQDATAAASYLRGLVWDPTSPGRTVRNLPRQRAEELVSLLLRYDLARKDWLQARTDAQYLADTFTRSPRYEHYRIDWLQATLGVQNYQSVINYVRTDPYTYRDDNLARQQDLLLAQAYLGANLADNALQQGKALLQAAGDDSLRVQAMLVMARAHEHKGRKRAGLDTYRELVSRYPAWVDAEETYMHIGNLYADDFARPDLAEPYYRQALANLSTLEGQARAHLGLARALQAQGRYEDAQLELDQVPVYRLQDQELARGIIEMRYRLHRLYTTDAQTAIGTLSTSLVAYTSGGTYDVLRDSLAIVLWRDMHQFEQALALVPDDGTPRHDLLRGLILLDLQEQTRAKGDTESASRYEAAANTILQRYASSPVGKELRLYSAQQADANTSRSLDLATSIDLLLAVNPQALTADLLHMVAGDIWLANGDTTRALPHLLALRPGALVPASEYRRGQMMLADVLYARGQLEEAYHAYRKANVNLLASGSERMYRFAMAQRAVLGEKSWEAVRFILDNGEPFPQMPEAIYFVSQRYVGGSLTYLKMMPEDQRDERYWLTLAETSATMRDWEQAGAALRAIEDKSVDVQEKQAEYEMRGGNFAEAIGVYTTLEERNPSRKTFYRLRRAFALYNQEEYTAALAVYDQVLPTLDIEKNLDGTERMQAMAGAINSAYRAENRPRAEAYRKQFKSVIESDPAYAPMFDLEEGKYYARMDPGKAIKLLRKLQEDQPNGSELGNQAAFWLGVAYINDSKPTEATTVFEPLAQQGDYPKLRLEAHLKLGTLAFSAEQYEKALEHYAWVIEHDSDGALARDALQNYVVVCKRIQSWDRAVAAYELMLKRTDASDVDAQARFDVAYCYYRDGKYDQAVEMFEKVLPSLETAELKAEAQYWIGASRFEQEDYDQAVNEYLKVSYSYPDLAQWAATAELKAADAYLRMGKDDRARTLLERVISKYGRNSDWGKEAAQVLDRL